MLLSVIMSVYNAELYLKEAIDSILNQTFSNFEFIIINDGSTDNSLNIINSYNDKRIVVINQPNQGLSTSLNNGIRIGKGEYIVRMDADDVSLSNRFEKQINFLEENKSYVLIGSNANIMDNEGNFLYTSTLPLCSNEIKNKFPESPFFHSSVIFRKDVWFKAGGYREDIIQYFEDIILWNAIAKHGDLANIEEPLINYRLVPTSISNNDIKTMISIAKLRNKIIETGTITESELADLKRITKVSKRKKLSNYYLKIGKIYLQYPFNRKLAIKNLMRSLFYLPINLAAWRNIVLAVLPKKVILRLKK